MSSASASPSSSLSLAISAPSTLGSRRGICWLRYLQRSRAPPSHAGRSGGGFAVVARVKKGQKRDYPWPRDIDPNLKNGHLSFLSSFKPLTERPKPVTLAFEKPLIDLEKKIIDVRKMADETGLDFSDQIISLENKYHQALKDLYTHLTPIQRLQIARHPNRPTFLDHILNMTEKWVELHGDRAGYDDPAIVTGLGSINGKTYMFIGHQKGRNTKENIQRNFGMPTPHGYRKALRMMRYADHHGFPIITLVDTPGAFADLKSEELGQGEAIAFNLREMFSLKVPIVSVIIGEGGSGGALAIACANKLLMLENAVFYVASPEACAAILWKSSQAAPKAAEKLKITSTELRKYKIADGIISEPLGGAHTDPSWTSQQIKIAVTKAIEELETLDTDSLLEHRRLKFRGIGGFIEGRFVEPKRKRNMKKKDADVSKIAAEIEVELGNIKKKAREAKGGLAGSAISEEAVEKLRKEVEKETINAFITMGLQEKLEKINMEISKSSARPDQALNTALKEKVERLAQEFNQGLARPGAYLGLKQKLETLNEVDKLTELREKGEKLKKEINNQLKGRVKAKLEILRKARNKVAKGELLDGNEVADVEAAKEDLQEMLKSANLEVVGYGKRRVPLSSRDLEDKVTKAEAVLVKEIEKAVNVGGLRGKVDELKVEIRKGTNQERIEELEKEIREGIVAFLDVEELKAKVENQTSASYAGTPIGGDNGRG